MPALPPWDGVAWRRAPSHFLGELMGALGKSLITVLSFHVLDARWTETGKSGMTTLSLPSLLYIAGGPGAHTPGTLVNEDSGVWV